MYKSIVKRSVAIGQAQEGEKGMKKRFGTILGIVIICSILVMIVSMITIKSNLYLAYAREEVNIEENKLDKQQTITTLSSSGQSSDLVLIDGIKAKNEQATVLSINSFTDVHHIPNANYFIVNPSHATGETGINGHGVCTTIALQLLMGYHNYYSDGRIIPPSISSSSGDISLLLDTNYRNPEDDPVFKRAIDEDGCSGIGTTHAFYNALLKSNTWSNSELFGQAIGVVTQGGNTFMENNTPAEVRNKISLTSGVFSKSEAQSEIDAGRPIVLGMHPFNDELSFHVVVAYGYAKLDNVDI